MVILGGWVFLMSEGTPVGSHILVEMTPAVVLNAINYSELDGCT